MFEINFLNNMAWKYITDYIHRLFELLHVHDESLYNDRWTIEPEMCPNVTETCKSQQKTIIDHKTNHTYSK